MDYSKWKHYDFYVQITDDTYICIVPKCGCSTVSTMSLDYHGYSIFYGKESINDFEYTHLNKGEYGDKWRKIHKLVFKKYEDISDKENKKFICIYRDPFERLISGYSVFANPNYSFEQYIYGVIHHWKKHEKDPQNINLHVRPQLSFFDPNHITHYIELKNFQKWTKLNNIKSIVINKSPKYNINYQVFDSLKDVFKKLYKDDFTFINNISEEKKIIL